MKEVSLKILFSVSLHSQFALGAPHRLTSFCVACSLRERTALLLRHFVFRFIDSIPESVLAFNRRLLLPVFLTTRFPNTLSQYYVPLAVFVPFPPCLHHASFALRSLCIPHPLWLGIPNTNSYALRWFLPHRFVRIVHLLRKRYTF